MISRRLMIAGLVGLGCTFSGGISALAASRDETLAAIPLPRHEKAMRQAIAAAQRNPAAPFGAVITRISDGDVLAEGVNSTASNPILHGEIATMNDYVRRHGNRDWQAAVLYTTAEPCCMCMGALVWAGIGGVVFGTSLNGLKRAGVGQIDIASDVVVAASPFWHGGVRGGVLADQTDRLFMERKLT